MDIYAIPYRGQYIVYRPLKRLAFIANAALVNFIADLQTNPSDSVGRQGSPADDFLESVGFFEPDPIPYEENASGQSFKPTIAVCLLTTACNFRCVYCYASAGQHTPQHLPIGLGRQAIDIVCRNAVAAGQSRFLLAFHGGGEPSLSYAALQALVAHARSKEIACKITIASNGYWGDQQRTWILDNLDEVSLSFDGTRDLQDRQRPLSSGGGTFPVVMKTIHEMDRRRFPYGIRLTVTEQGIDELPGAMAFLCRETECATFQAEPAFKHGRAYGNNVALGDNERFTAAFMEAVDVATAHGRQLYYSGARPGVITDRFCQAIEHALIVAPDGGLTACYEVFGAEHSLASAFFYGTLDDSGRMSVDDERRQSLQQAIAERRLRCRGCFCYWHCAGDCPPKSLASASGTHQQFGPRCDLNRRITTELLVRHITAGNGVWCGDTEPIKRPRGEEWTTRAKTTA